MQFRVGESAHRLVQRCRCDRLTLLRVGVEQAATALAVADAEGLAAVSMRRVAGDLGSGTATLYRYITNRGLERVLDGFATRFGKS
ncbi:MAG TPA: hypothetical protein VFX16_19825 [Pseudonocardiaceae bacterium]|nr:hypothetical protein [Pseudonocardiaceae bacterium]